MKPGPGLSKHITEFYREQFIEQSGLSAAEHKSAVGMPLIRPTPADMNKGKEILAEHGVMPTLKPVVIHPGSGGREKCWHLDNFLSIAETLANEGIEVVFLLGPAEMERFERVGNGKNRSRRQITYESVAGGRACGPELCGGLCGQRQRYNTSCRRR